MNTNAQSIALFYAPLITGITTFTASCIMARLLVKGLRQRMDNNEHSSNPVLLRLLLALSISDAVHALHFAMSGLAVPSSEHGFYGNIGTWFTCELQGFMLVTGIAAPLYAAALCIFYFCTICLEKRNFPGKALEVCVHAAVVLWAVTAGTLGWVWNIYNPTPYNQRCMPIGYPHNCYIDPSIECTRGKRTVVYIDNAYVYPMYMSLILVFLGTTAVYLKVRRTIFATSQFATTGGRLAREAKIQAILYQVTFLISHFWVIAFFIFVLCQRPPPFLLRVVVVHPFQGFCNLIVYLRPRYVRLRRRYPEVSRRKVIFSLLRGVSVYRPSRFDEDHSTGNSSESSDPQQGSWWWSHFRRPSLRRVASAEEIVGSNGKNISCDDEEVAVIEDADESCVSSVEADEVDIVP